MTDDGLTEGELHRRRRRVNKGGSRKRRKLIQNVWWVVGGFLVGLPVLVLMIYIVSALAAYF